MTPPVAHVLAPSTAPVSLGWTVSLSLAIGLCLLFLAPRAWRWAATALCLVAAVSGLSLVVVGSQTPARPDLRLRLVAPSAAAVERTSPVEVHVCAVTAAGSPAALPGPGRLLAVLVDGTSVATEASSVFALEMAPGAHRLSVELVTAGHRAFSPPLLATTTVRVSPGGGPLAAGGSCPG